MMSPSLRGGRKADEAINNVIPAEAGIQIVDPLRAYRLVKPEARHIFGEERHIIVDNVKVVTISAGAKAPASSSRTLLEMSVKLIPKSARAKGAQRSAPRIGRER